MNFYVKPSGKELLQGDILFPVPFVGFSILTACVIEENGSRRNFDNKNAETGRIAASFESGWGLVISQSCDLAEHAKDLVSVARIYPAKDRFNNFKEEPDQFKKNFLPQARNSGKMPQNFYLPETDDKRLGKSVAYLLEIESYPRVDYPHLVSLVRYRLAPAALQALQERIAYCFGRFAAPDDLYL